MSEADLAVLRTKPNNAESSMIVIGELMAIACGSINRCGCSPSVVTRRLQPPLHRRLIRVVLRGGRAYLSVGDALARPASAERNGSISRITLLKLDDVSQGRAPLRV